MKKWVPPASREELRRSEFLRGVKAREQEHTKTMNNKSTEMVKGGGIKNSKTEQLF